MKFFQYLFLTLILSTTNAYASSEAFIFIKKLNSYLEDKGLKVQDYRPSKEHFSGYKLNFVVTDPEALKQNETIKNIYMNDSFNTAIIVYKKEFIDPNIRDWETIELIDSFSGFFKRIDDKYYSNAPLFKEPHTVPYSDNLFEFHNDQRSFIIDKNKTFITSSTVLFFNGEEFSNFSENKINADNLTVRNIISDIYEKQEQITFIPNDMDNMAVVFFSRAMESSLNIFEMKDIINQNKLGLLFLPYYNLQEDMVKSKDYQLFCQQDFSLTIELAMLEDLSKDFSCPDNEQAAQRLVNIYKARNEILDFYHLDFTKPYYYFYKEMKLIDYEYFKK